MKSRIVALALWGCLLLGSAGWAQNDITVELQMLNPGAQIFPLGDLDLTGTGQIPALFRVTITNNSQNTVTIKLCLEFRLNGTVIAQTESNAFDLPPGIVLSYTNQELNAGTAVIPQTGQTVEFNDYNVDFSAVADLESQVLNTGRAPAGLYELFLFYRLRQPDGSFTNCISGDPNEEDNRVIITNPTTVELVFPGSSVSESTIQEISTIFPYFQWQTDAAPTSDAYNVYIYEKLPEDRTTQDVLSHPPILELRRYPETFFQFPSQTNDPLLTQYAVGPIRLLEFGKVYYWKVESIIPSATGEVILESDVFRFKIADYLSSSYDAKLILGLLQQILGSGYEVVLQELVEKGYEPNGKITIEGSPADVSDLIQFLNEVLQGKARVKGIEIY
ncbi:MAG: hypothetical protein D6681_00675 [Calditrichaeota bacterium]|nr:MAG: hypothetical protein D6681_00675 [Calditrichota bacterium]